MSVRMTSRLRAASRASISSLHKSVCDAKDFSFVFIVRQVQVHTPSVQPLNRSSRNRQLGLSWPTLKRKGPGKIPGPLHARRRLDTLLCHFCAANFSPILVGQLLSEGKVVSTNSLK